jgi:hypothetical protein
MTEETNVIHALRRLRRLAESRLDPAIGRRSAVVMRPTRCAGDLAAAAERSLAPWHTAGTAAAAADLRILGVAVLALSDQLAAKDREQGGGPAWAGEAPSAAADSLTAPDIADLPPGLDPAGWVTALTSGLWELHGWLAVPERTSSQVTRR